MKTQNFIALVAIMAQQCLAAATGEAAMAVEKKTLVTRAQTLFKVCRNTNFNDCWDAPTTINECSMC